MNLELLIKALGWAAVINYAVLAFWFLVFMFARNLIYRLHHTWFKIPDDQFDTTHYFLMGVYKLFTLLLFLSPYIALRIIA